VNAINLLYEKINDKQKEEIVIAIAGKVDSRISHLFPFQVFELGYLSPNHLVNAYRMADVFISPSIQDTGPLMVLQSLMCGTAVVTFEMGNSQEFVHNYKTGFQAPLYDSEKLMEGLMYFLTRTEIESLNISKDCRNFAVENASYNYFSKVFIQIYNNFLLLNK
jgi:glycosyltransferase involved in cell wall biosynthesis